MWRIIVSIMTALGALMLSRPRGGERTRIAVAPGAPATDAAEGAAGGHTGGHAGHKVEAELRPGWGRPKPEVIPRATYWPILLAGGISFVFWGLISDIWIFGAGVLLSVASMIGWINDLLNE